MKKLSIGMVCYPTYGGSGVIAVELAQALAARGHQIHLMSLAPPVRLNQFASGVYFHEIKGMSGWPYDHSWYDVALANKIVELSKTASVSLVHAHYAMPHAVSAYLAKQMLRLEGRRLPIVTTLHGTDVTLVSEHQSFEKVMHFAMVESDGLTAVSKYLAEATQRQMGITHPIRVIPNGVNVDRFKPARSGITKSRIVKRKGPVLMHLSNFRPLKRVSDVVEIFARVRSRMPATLVLVGDGPDQEKVSQLVREKRLGADVVFLGKQEGVEKILPCADVFLLPSEQESFGLAALEAMACGVPVVASRVGGLSEVVEHGVQGFLEPVGDVEAMAGWCMEVLNQPARAKKMGEAGRRRAVHEFGIGLMVDRYERYYREVLKPQRTRKS